MAESFRIPWWFWRLQYQLLGGHRRVAAITLGYVVLIAIGAWSWSRTNAPLTVISSQILNLIIVIQSMVVGFGGCNAVYRAVLRDYQSRMIESHRMTAMSSLSTVIGYLFGATLQVLGIFLVNVFSGIVISYLVGLPIGMWAAGNFTMLSGSLTLWAMTIYAGMGLNKPVSPLPAMLGIGLLSVPILLVPAAGVWSGLYSAVLGAPLAFGTNLIAKISMERMTVPTTVALFVFQQMFTGFWLWAAARRFRRPDLPVFNAKGGLLLLLGWVVVSLVGLRVMDEALRAADPTWQDRSIRFVPWIGTIIGGLIISVVAIAGSVETFALVQRGRQARDRRDRWSSVTVLLLCLGVMIGGLSVYLFYAWNDPRPTILFGFWGARNSKVLLTSWLLHTTVPFALALVSAQGIMTFFLLRPTPIKRLGGILILTLWTGPLIIDAMNMIYQTIMEVRHIQLSWVWSCSPLGTIAGAWQRDFPATHKIGLVFQGITAIIAQIAAIRAIRLWEARFPSARTQPAN